jgi:UDP-glucuronate 4-epimerase
LEDRIVVLGAAGFIGSHLCEQLLLENYEVLGIDAYIDESYPGVIKRKNIAKSLLHPNFSFMECDLRDQIAPNTFRNNDVIINEAAMPGLPLSWTNSKFYFQSNTFVPINVLSNLEGLQIKKYIQISTSSVYGKFAVGDENLPLQPISPYGVSKLSAEFMVSNLCNNLEIPYNTLRYFSVFGPRQRPDMAYSQIIRKCMAGDEIEIFGDGKQSRTNTFVSDIVSGTIQTISKGISGEIYNLAGNQSVNLLEVIDFIKKNLDSKSKIKFLKPRQGDQRQTEGIFRKATSQLGYFPVVDFWEGLERQIKWHCAEVSF